MNQHRRIEIAFAEHHRDVRPVGTDRVPVFRVGGLVDADLDRATVGEEQEVVCRSSLVEAHHHGPSLVAGPVMVLASGKRDRRRERNQHAHYGNKSHVTSYVYRTPWNRSGVKDRRLWPGLGYVSPHAPGV